MVVEDPSVFQQLMRFKPDGLTPNGWALKAGVSRTVWADMRRHGNPSRRTLEKLLTAAGSSLAEFEALRIGGEPANFPPAAGFADRTRQWRAAPVEPLPLFTCSLVGEWDRNGRPLEIFEMRRDNPADRRPRPQSLAFDPEAYAVSVMGESMWPRFSSGQLIAVSPGSPVAAGDDVLIRLRPGRDPGRNCALIARLVRQGGDEVELRRFKPDVLFTLPARDIERIEKIAGELI